MNIKTIKAPALLFIASIAIALMAIISVRANAQQETVQITEVETTTQQNDQNTPNNDNTFNYVAQPGDSYSLMARKAIQTYGIINNINLSPAQIIFAETNLTNQAGSPVLTTGQAVSIKESDVKNWVEKAQQLSAEQQSAWDYYVVGVDFNTNSVGQ